MVIDRSRYFTRSLLSWYRHSGRSLPWRDTSDPYLIWLSEIMLQQTQVATVLPYYHSFITTFPTIQDLAAASLDDVMKRWAGLGYYARARHLHQAATEVLRKFDGRIPSRYEDIISLPGIGRSTAGAILTIAFKQRWPILDGNVRRVLCRYFLIDKDPKGKEVEVWLWDCSERLLPKKEAHVYTQAIMDLGATICTPKRPQCLICPVNKGCGAYQEGVEETLPVRAVRKKVPHFDHVAGIIFDARGVLIRRRPLKGLLGGLWELPGGRLGLDFREEGHENSVKTLLETEMGFYIEVSHQWMEIKHVFTHFKMTLHVFICRKKKKGIDQSSKHHWVPIEKLGDYAFSSAQQKIVVKLSKEGCSSGLFSKERTRLARNGQIK
ncbi:MAG TPA: A/G-specific adenine glycosylase [Nitrospiria bacterium]|nr:A/G-specific adenine glycosylase [Candidatus Manganitrophaceae bacterium]HIL33841.1 A/G-specific adenine glycosylase [Candidatus Manganitrophaceae bacterium]